MEHLRRALCDREQVRTHAQERGFAFESSEDVQELVSTLRIPPAGLEVAHEPAGAFQSDALDLKAGRLYFALQLLGSVEVGGGEVVEPTRQVAVLTVRQIARHDSGEIRIGQQLSHQAVERQRGQSIPDWAHRDVLYMLIDYSERAHELLARPLHAAEQRELYDVFYRVGTGLRIPGLPPTYAAWRADRQLHLRRDLLHGDGTEALYAQYRNHLGPWRYHLLLRIQSILTPGHVRGMLRLKRAEWLRPFLRFYPILVRAGLRSIIQQLLMPSYPSPVA